MTDFWKRAVENVGGPLTEETFLAAVKHMREQQDIYRSEPPQPIVYPPFLAKEMRK